MSFLNCLWLLVWGDFCRISFPNPRTVIKTSNEENKIPMVSIRIHLTKERKEKGTLTKLYIWVADNIYTTCLLLTPTWIVEAGHGCALPHGRSLPLGPLPNCWHWEAASGRGAPLAWPFQPIARSKGCPRAPTSCKLRLATSLYSRCYEDRNFFLSNY